MIIIEGKLEDLSKKYIPKFDETRFVERITPESLIKHLYDSDPSPTKKYFEWMILQCLELIDSNYTINNEMVGGIVNDVLTFDSNIDKLDDEFLEYNKERLGNTYNIINNKPLKDINTYSVFTLRSVIIALRQYKSKTERKKLTKEGGKLVFQDDKYKVFEIDNYEASCFYGKGSRWCTTSKESDSNFRTYGTGRRKLLYVISKTKTIETDPQFYKIAINIKYNDEQITFWDAPDKPFDGWTYFRAEDPNILKFLISYIKEKDPDNYLNLLPEEYLTAIKQDEEGLTDLELILDLDRDAATKFLAYKYNLSIPNAIIKKLDLLKDDVDDYLSNYFTSPEKEYLIKNSDDILKPRGLTWKDFVKSYHELAITTEYIPSAFIEKFLGGDKNKLLEIGKNELVILYWLAKGSQYISDLGKLYGAEKLVKYIVKNETKAIFSLTSVLPRLLRGDESPKKIRELFEIAYEYDGVKNKNIELGDFLTREMSNNDFIASFNKGDGKEIEPNSYGRAFIYLKQNAPDSISSVFKIEDLTKIFKTQEKAFSYLLKNYDEFEKALNLSDLSSMFVGAVPDSIFGKYMGNWEKSNAVSTYKREEGCKKLFDFVVKKFSFKKLADIIGYDGVFQLFSIVGFKKGINYMVQNKVGDIAIDDIRIQNGKPILVVNNRADYAFLFDDDSLAEKVLGEDLDWEPYNDVVYDWYNQVWECVDLDSIQLVKAWIKSNVTEYENDEGEMIDLGDTFLNEIDDDDLGHIIDGYGEFGELKREMSWAYDSAYNVVAKDDIIREAQDELETYLGNYIGYEPIKKVGRRYNKEKRTSETFEYTAYEYLYDLGDNFYEVLKDYSSNEFGYSPDYNTYFSRLLKDSDPKKLYLNEEPDPYEKDVCKYFNEDLPGRI